MNQLKTAFLALLQVTLAGIAAWLLGLWLGNALLAVALVFGLLLFWHIYSSRWLSVQLKQSAEKKVSSLSFLPLTLEDSQLRDEIYEQQLQNVQTETSYTNLLEIIRTYSDALPYGMIVIDADNQAEWINQKAAEYLGVDITEDIGRRIEKIVHQLHFSDWVNDQHPLEINGPLDEKTRLRLSFTAFANGNRLISIQDITPFQRVDEMRQNFIGNASHELRTPLTVLRGYIEEMLEDAQIPDYWNAPISAMDKQVNRMQNIIEDMLTLSSLESQLSLAGFERVHLYSLIEQVSNDIEQAFQKSHQVVRNIPSDIYIKGIESELYSVISNLVKNAFIYSQEHSDVRIDFSAQDDEFVLIVIDKGMGIPAESIERLTERFYRVDDDRSRKRGGTGLGLAIVKHALLRHEAHLSIESEIGQGSRFKCHFPKHRIITS